MASILDTFCGVAEESTYGTAITSGFRGYEAQSDSFTREVEYIESVGFRQALQTIRSDRHDTISIGASGSIETDVLTKGHGLLLKHMLGGSSIAQLGGTAAWKQTMESSDDGPSGSYTVQLPRTDSSGTLQSFTYEGCVPTGFTITQNLDEALKLTVDFDSENEQMSTAASSPTYPTDADVFVFTDATIEVAGSAINTFTSFSLTGDLGMNTERRFLKGSATKLQPARSAVPSYTGTIEGEFTNAQYEAFRDGTIFQLELICAKSVAIAGSYFPTFHLTLPKCKFTGSTPVASQDDLTRLSLPFTVLWDGSNAAVKVEYTSTDTSF
jgi:hypothetical protein